MKTSSFPAQQQTSTPTTTTPKSSTPKATGLGLLSVLQADLRSISQEAKVRFPQLKDASDRGITILKSIEEQSTSIDVLIQSLAKSDDVLKPLLMACDTKNQKLIAFAVGSILKLISQSAVSMSTLPEIISKMSTLIEVGEESVQLKVLQGLLILITTMNSLHDDLLAQCLVLCLRLNGNNRSIHIQNTSAATLPQIIRHIFDRVILERNGALSPCSLSNSQSLIPPHISIESTNMNSNNNGQGHGTSGGSVSPPSQQQQQHQSVNSTPPTTSTTTTITPLMRSCEVDMPVQSPLMGSGSRTPYLLKPCAKDAFLLLQDLCYITDGDHPVWLPPSTLSTLTHATGMELIEMVLSAHQIIFLEIEEFRYLLKDKICPLLIKALRMKLSFANSVRLMRVITQFISKYGRIMVAETDVLLTKMIRMMDSDNPQWMQVLALESFKVYCEDAALLRIFYQHYDISGGKNSAMIFRSLTSSIGIYMQGFATVDGCFVHVNTSKNKHLDMLSATDIPDIKESFIVTLCTECIAGIVNSVVSQTDDSTNNESPNGSASTSTVGGERQLLAQMVESCWTTVLASLSLLLGRSNDELLLQIALKSLQSFTNTCGRLQMSAPRDALLTALCKATVPPLTWSPASGDSTTIEVSSSEYDGRPSGFTPVLGGGQQARGGVDQFGVYSPQPQQALPTQKNIMAVKTLMNIAHCMGSILDEAWILVLETLESWDRLLKQQQQQTLQQQQQQDDRSPVAGYGSPRVGQAELSILMNAMNNLFKRTCQLDERSISFLFGALSKLCSNALSKSPGTPINMFSITKLVEASVSNLYRIDKLWGFISTQLVETCNFRNSYIRIYGVESLMLTIIKTALQLPPPIHSGAGNGNGNGNGTDSPPMVNGEGLSLDAGVISPDSMSDLDDELDDDDDPRDHTQYHQISSIDSMRRYRRWNIEKLQVEFFNAIEEISFSQYPDTKQKILECIHQILSTSGHILSTAWPVLLSILLKIPQTSDKSLILVAFESVKLIYNEFLPNMAPECLVICIELIKAFVSQKADINISLTASSGLFSDLTYFLDHETAQPSSKYSTVAEVDEEDESSIEDSKTRAIIAASSPYFTDKDQSVINRMWLCAFTTMKSLCIDHRAAVRNGVIVALFQTLSNSIHLFGKDLISTILWKILFPLIEEVIQYSVQADKERIDSDLGGGVMLLVHHSRNTAQKQWDETQVLPLGRLIILFKTYFETLSQLPTFVKAWDRLLYILQTESLSSSREVSMSALASLHELIGSPIVESTRPDLCESMWRVYTNLATQLTDPSVANAKSLHAYVVAFLDLYHKSKESLSNAQLIRMLQILYPLGLCCNEPPSKTLSVPQLQTLQLLKSLPPIHPDVYPHVMVLLMTHIANGIGYKYVASCTTTKAMYPDVMIRDLGQLALVTERYIELSSELYLHQSTSDEMRAVVFSDLIDVYMMAMMIKCTNYKSNVWKVATANLIKVIPKGLAAINQDTTGMDGPTRLAIWIKLADSLQRYIIKERVDNLATCDLRWVEDQYDVNLVDIVANDMIGFKGVKIDDTSVVKQRLSEILYQGSVMGSQGRIALSQACYRNMFFMCAKANIGNAESVDTAKEVLPVLIKRSKEVLQRFIKDERQSGQLPMPTHQLSEVVFLLKELRSLSISPGWYNSKHNRPHLTDLAPTLSDCISTSEQQVKEQLKGIFHIIVSELIIL
ncbi:hypothetical protein SAMD00019534_017790 [Acytostelium subglobosum LB1]|uniref:hypothetical protein n=1 Tax=Acytostelium subglobosum LB1 TaxID=1410327 RepID=UPI000645201F|nr:hypothetical protein SAMD00019534_017790 [Acytostelium subglobosum LB1]GAM18604.1 hypothetical protein SAMD00019534_017790 [Acytostelium subglobosum LB1]|eukprot:XP_012757824.1 hypothetical protein SAMD00019534_017790 [Acytostelium subglobosum LB1]